MQCGNFRSVPRCASMESLAFLFFYVALIILIVIFTPLLIALGFSIWTGTRASVPAAGASS
jgi:hypothetical protein